MGKWNLIKKRRILLPIAIFAACVMVRAEDASFLVLGDIHYDLLQDHDLGWLATKPDDLRQVTKEYTVFTQKFFKHFMGVVARQSRAIQPPVKAVVQLGDLQEGLAGTPELARKMAADATGAIGRADAAAPWVLVKGNHDITGPGASDAFQEVVIPWLRKELRQDIQSANYSVKVGPAEIFCADTFDRKVDFVEALDRTLGASKARYKFVAMHEPVIPVTERCWHVLREPQSAARREKLLEVLARHHAIVLCAHLHRYSVVRRMTEHGPVVQVMMNSVIREANPGGPYSITTDYGPSLVDRSKWEPKSAERRKAMLAEEARHVTDYRMADMPGYGVIAIDDQAQQITLKAYCGLSEQPYEQVNLSALLNGKSAAK